MPARFPKTMRHPASKTSPAKVPCTSCQRIRIDGPSTGAKPPDSDPPTITPAVTRQPAAITANPKSSRGPLAWALKRTTCAANRLTAIMAPMAQPPKKGILPGTSASAG